MAPQATQSHLDQLLQQAQRPTVSISGRLSAEEAEQLDELLDYHKLKRQPFASVALRDALSKLPTIPEKELAEFRKARKLVLAEKAKAAAKNGKD